MASPQLASIDNARVTKWVTRFTTSLRDEFDIYLKRMASYAPMIADKLAERNMPAQLVYLPMIESGYSPTAKSPVQATGMWQFMSATARKYGLVVNNREDERKDPEKSTDAALSYLSDLYKRFGSWYLAAAAYNAGPGRVASVLKKATGQTTGSDADYFRISHALPAETQDYVPKLIAVARVAEGARASSVTPAVVVHSAEAPRSAAASHAARAVSSGRVLKSRRPALKSTPSAARIARAAKGARAANRTRAAKSPPATRLPRRVRSARRVRASSANAN